MICFHQIATATAVPAKPTSHVQAQRFGTIDEVSERAAARRRKAPVLVHRSRVDAAPLSLRAWRPAPERWSVDEIVEHLSIVEPNVAKLLDKRLRRLEEAKLPIVGAE